LSPPAGPILITGAEGFVGRHLIAALRARWPDIALVAPALDVRDAGAVMLAVRDAAPACCVHLAAIASVAQAAAEQDEAWRVNLHGTLHLAQAILTHAPSCQLLFASSADAYGAAFRAGVALDETAILAPMTIYGATKAAADLALGSLAPAGLRSVRLRPFNHIGAGQSADFVIASFARQIARIEAGLQPPVLTIGRADTFRDFLDVSDVCAAYLACIAGHAALAPGTILNIASGRARRIGDVLAEMLAMSAVAIEVIAEPSRVRATDIARAEGDAGMARAMLGWAPSIPWRDTLAAILDDWRRRAHRPSP
jgi:GDP-4-dehydro-6-deoxy-D-mannose reductase